VRGRERRQRGGEGERKKESLRGVERKTEREREREREVNRGSCGAWFKYRGSPPVESWPWKGHLHHHPRALPSTVLSRFQT
jgi:hypothetical protein